VSISRALPPLYFLVEETHRELSSRVLLATAGVRAGFSAFIIPQWFAWENVNALPPGIVIFKGNNNAQSSRMAAARAAGHLVAAIEEEILGVTDPEVILSRFQPPNVDACQLFLLQGDHARDVLTERHPHLSDRLKVTGNPRTDLLRRPFDGQLRDHAETVRREHGDYILINTNFGATNPRVEDSIAFRNLCIRVGLLDPDKEKDREEFVERCRWERGNMALLAKVIATCEASLTLPRVIIRPHPSENIDKWRWAYRDHQRVSIIREGDHLPWTAGARLLLHTGCTTGVEAMLLGTPALCLRGGASRWHLHLTSNHVNPTATSHQSAMSKINGFFGGHSSACVPSQAMWRELERQLLPNGQRTAAESIISALEVLSEQASPHAKTGQALAHLASAPLSTSDHKINKLAFSEKAVAENARLFADYLGHPNTPRVTRLGEAVIGINPKD
jgi:surface carbohydrate biosynthesis protein